MIYLIDFQTCYKIGRTSDLRKRLRQFKNTRENFQCLDLIIDHNCMVDTVVNDQKLESELHKRCKKFNISGELFQKCDEVLEIFKQYKTEVGDNKDYAQDINKILSCQEIKNSRKGKDTFQYDLSGNFIKKFSSRSEAEKILGIYKGRIKEVISGRNLTAGGFIWSDHILSKEELSDVITKISRSKRSKINSKLNQYDMNGNFIKSWDTLSQASKELNISVSSISLCCSGKYKKAGGYKWKIE